PSRRARRARRSDWPSSRAPPSSQSSTCRPPRWRRFPRSPSPVRRRAARRWMLPSFEALELLFGEPSIAGRCAAPTLSSHVTHSDRPRSPTNTNSSSYRDQAGVIWFRRWEILRLTSVAHRHAPPQLVKKVLKDNHFVVLLGRVRGCHR